MASSGDERVHELAPVVVRLGDNLFKSSEEYETCLRRICMHIDGVYKMQQRAVVYSEHRLPVSGSKQAEKS